MWTAARRSARASIRATHSAHWTQRRGSTAPTPDIATDDFSIDFVDLPEGWSSNADQVGLDGGEEADALPELVPAADAETGVEVDGVFVDDSSTFTATTDTDGVAITDYRVLTAAERVEQLRDHVTDADLRHGIERSLTAKLEATLESLDAGDSESACHTLQAFANQVQALQGRHVSEARAAAWLHETQSIRAQLGCSA
ncbi:MAG: hypothetical protein ACR2FV_13200 [Ornithinimicrobium sp.]|uniref:hypothetical protein n=1 Tax=Ornithinimicrobium sp. TaxID=1977084 RepID=UPI003D9B61CB